MSFLLGQFIENSFWLIKLTVLWDHLKYLKVLSALKYFLYFSLLL